MMRPDLNPGKEAYLLLSRSVQTKKRRSAGTEMHPLVIRVRRTWIAITDPTIRRYGWSLCRGKRVLSTTDVEYTSPGTANRVAYKLSVELGIRCELYRKER